MGPTGVVQMLVVVVLTAFNQNHLTTALKLSNEELSSSGDRTLAFMYSQRTAAVQAVTGSSSSRLDSTKGGIPPTGRSLSASQRRKPASAPSSDKDGAVYAPGSSAGLTGVNRMALTDDQIRSIEAKGQQKQLSVAGHALNSFAGQRRTRRHHSLAARAAAAALGVSPQSVPAMIAPANICLNKNGDPNYNMLGYNGKNFSQLSSYPYNTVVRLEIVEFNAATGDEGNRYLCTATALSDVILVTSSHCVKPGPDSNFPNIYTIAYYGYDGKRATAGTRVSRCIAWYDDLTQVDNAIIVLKQPMKLPKYMAYGYVNAVVPRKNAATWMLSYPADAVEMACLGNLGVDNPYYYGMVQTAGVNSVLNYRVGRRCEAGDKYAIWAMGSMIGGQSGGCLVHDKTDTCIGTAAYSCELPSACSSDCPNAWGGFNAEFPLSGLWQTCGITGT